MLRMLVSATHRRANSGHWVSVLRSTARATSWPWTALRQGPCPVSYWIRSTRQTSCPVAAMVTGCCMPRTSVSAECWVCGTARAANRTTRSASGGPACADISNSLSSSRCRPRSSCIRAARSPALSPVMAPPQVEPPSGARRAASVYTAVLRRLSDRVPARTHPGCVCPSGDRVPNQAANPAPQVGDRVRRRSGPRLPAEATGAGVAVTGASVAEQSATYGGSDQQGEAGQQQRQAEAGDGRRGGAGEGQTAHRGRRAARPRQRSTGRRRRRRRGR